MLEWVLRVSEQVQQLANNDPEYRELTQRRSAEKVFGFCPCGFPIKRR